MRYLRVFRSSRRVGLHRGPIVLKAVVAAVGATLLLSSTVVASSGASMVAAPNDGYPQGVTLYPARLERGANTPLLHSRERTVVDGRTTIAVRGIPHFWMLGRVGRGYLLQTADRDFERYAVVLLRRDGSRRVLQSFDQRTTPVASANGRHLALVTPDRPSTRVRVVETRSGDLVRQRRFRSYGVEVSDFGRRRMVITGLRSRTFWWNPTTDRRSLIVRRPAAADIGADRLVVSIPHPTDEFAECQKTVELSRPSVVLWQSCQDRSLTFSPDGSRMASVYINTDGIGPGVVQIRLQDGTLVRTLRAPMFFGFVEWESNRSLLLQPVGKSRIAAVRCHLGGACKRASRLYRSPGTFDPPTTMVWSFP